MPPDTPSDPTTVFVTTHIHTDGPIPGPHSLLTLTSAAHRADGVPTGTFTANLRELPGATLHPASLQDWRTRAVDWLATRRAARPPALATIAYARWVERLPGRAVFVAEPHTQDYLFVYWYLQRFAGEWPFAGSLSAASSPIRSARAAEACVLASCRTAPGPGLAAAG
ncbi:hypothetical protein [Pseudonocardia sp. NPDC049154]|uniref:hypothetical protein n=1 Tax=Pseudonocardia sp. NPDC049154 TaxID=3155501 RepID=UPI0033D3EF41